MKVTLLFILLLSFAVIGISQDRARITVDIPSNQKPWNHIDLNNNPDNFKFAIVTDRTGGHRPGVFLDGILKLNLLQPEFVMSVGDLIEGYTTDTSRLNAEWREFNGFIDSLEMPFFYVPGNHDITNQVMEDKWKEIFGVTYYHFVYNDVLFLCLNSEDNKRGAGRGTIDDEQYEYIKKTLEENQDVKWTLVFLHQPLWVQNDTKRWKDVEGLLQDRPHNVFAGHYHRYWKSERNSGKYIALATTGGASRLRGVSYGEFDHVVWVTMTEQGPILANLLLEGIWDEDVVTNELVEFVRNRPFPIKLEPVYVDSPNQEKVEVEVRVTNDSDYKMTATLNGSIHSDLHYGFEKSDLDLEPNTVEVMKMTIENIKGADLTKVEPISINMSAIFDYPERPELAVNNSVNYKVFLKRKVGKLQGKVKVDGNLKEWEGEAISVSGMDHIGGNRFHYEGDKDVNMKFRTAYDDDFVYLAVEVQDDELVVKEGESAFRQDAVIVGLDARSLKISTDNGGQGRGSDWLFIAASAAKDGGIYTEPAKLPEGSQVAVKKSGEGITTEIAIPVSYFDKMQGQAWQNFRLGLGYNDFDKAGTEKNELFWFPAWNSRENIRGSGMFFRD